MQKLKFMPVLLFEQSAQHTLSVPEGKCGNENTANASTLNSPGISSLKTSDEKWLKMLIKRKMFTKSAVSVIQSLIAPGSLTSDSDTSSDGGDEYEMDGNDNADDVLCL